MRSGHDGAIAVYKANNLCISRKEILIQTGHAPPCVSMLGLYEKGNKMSVKTIIVGALCLSTSLILAPLHAQSNIIGIGALTCDEFANEFQSASEDTQSGLVWGVFSWVQGYSSGKNLERPNEADQKDLTTLDPESVFNQVVGICTISGTIYIYEVAELIYDRLPPMPEASV